MFSSRNRLFDKSKACALARFSNFDIPIFFQRPRRLVNSIKNGFIAKLRIFTYVYYVFIENLKVQRSKKCAHTISNKVQCFLHCSVNCNEAQRQFDCLRVFIRVEGVAKLVERG